MKREFIIERSGQTFVKYAGLLDEAHTQGLRKINTSLIQIPTRENEMTAIVEATAIMEKDGIGDASFNNVAPAMRTCLIRMAETRAKARALRDAINVGICALEEVAGGGEYEEEQSPRQRASQREAAASRQRSEKPDRVYDFSQEETSGSRGAVRALCPNCNAPEGLPHAKGCPKRQ